MRISDSLGVGLRAAARRPTCGGGHATYGGTQTGPLTLPVPEMQAIPPTEKSVRKRFFEFCSSPNHSCSVSITASLRTNPCPSAPRAVPRERRKAAVDDLSSQVLTTMLNPLHSISPGWTVMRRLVVCSLSILLRASRICGVPAHGG